MKGFIKVQSYIQVENKFEDVLINLIYLKVVANADERKTHPDIKTFLQMADKTGYQTTSTLADIEAFITENT